MTVGILITLVILGMALCAGLGCLITYLSGWKEWGLGAPLGLVVAGFGLLAIGVAAVWNVPI